MKLDTQTSDYDLNNAGANAVRFEAMGFDAVWTFEAAHDPFMALGVAAISTKRLEIGTNISVAFGRSPFAMAQVAWDLQHSSRGRFHLGLGTQVRAHIERRFSMPFDHPARRVADYIRCVRAIWDTFQTDAKPDYRGEFYQFRLMNPFFNPGPIEHPKIPIYLAGVNPLMCRTAGEVADGFHVHPMNSAGFLRDVVRPAIAEGATKGGRNADDVALYAPIFAVTGEDQREWDKAEREVRRQISFYASTPNYRVLLEYYGLEALGKELSAKARRGEWQDMPKHIPDSLMEEVAVIGTSAEIPGKLAERYRGLLDRVSLYFPIPARDSTEKWTQFAEAFRAADGAGA